MNSKVQELIDDLKSKSYSFERTTITDSKYSVTKTIADIHLSNDTIRDRINYMAHKYPDSIAYRFCDTEHDDITFTYSQVKQRVEIISQNLLNIGLKKGDCIAYQYCNSYESMIILFASASIGLISVPLGPNYITFDVEYMLKKANVKCLFIMDEFNNCKYFELFKQICPELDNCEIGQLNSARLPDLKHVILSRMDTNKSKEENECKGVWKYEEIGENNESFRYDYELPSISCHDPFVIIYTSGTTGQRKGCVMNFYKIFNSARISFSADSIKVNCSLFGMFAMGGLLVSIMPPLYYPAQLIIPNKKTDFQQTIKIINKYKCKTLSAAPKVLYDLNNYLSSNNELIKNVKSVDYIFSGGQPCIKELIENCQKNYDLAKFCILYGMTEICIGSTSFVSKNLIDKRDILSLGKINPFFEGKLVDPSTGKVLPLGSIGEMYIRSFANFCYYWKDEEKTEEVIDKDGWLKTGDMMRMDKDGYIFYLDRFKDYIDIGGHKVYPSEIESLIKQHQSVSAVNVFGIDLDVLQETICAWIILKKDCLNTTVDDIKLFCKDQLMEYRIPTYMKFVSDFPTDPGSGKMLKREMSKIYKQEIVSQKMLIENLNRNSLTEILFSETIRDRLEFMSKNYSDKIAYVFYHQNEIKITYSELKQRVFTMSQSLISIGVRKGDRVAYQIYNSFEIIIILFASANIGAIAVPLEPNYLAFDLEYMLKKTGSKCLFIMNEFDGYSYFDMFRGICPEIDSCTKGNLASTKFPNLKHVILIKINQSIINPFYQSVWEYQEIADKNEIFSYNHELPDLDPHDSFIITFTSGTTGQRKGCVQSFYSCYNSSRFAFKDFSNEYLESSCNMMRMFHVGSLGTAILPSLYFPSKIIFPDYKSNVSKCLEVIEKYKCKSLIAAPKIVHDILSYPSFNNYNLSGLKYILSGSQICSKELIESCREKFNFEYFIIAYGMTESGLISESFINKYIKDKRDIESIGKLSPLVECKVIDPETGSILPPGINGELCIKSFSVMKNYWDDPEKTKEAFDRDGWLKTGDLVRMDKDGYLFYIDRIKDFINIGGQKVYPSEIEALLEQHPCVSLVSVFGVSLNEFQEVICAWIILKNGIKCSVQDIKDFCQDKIISNRIPKYIKLVDDFPTGPTNKILKKEMSRVYKLELSSKLK